MQRFQLVKKARSGSALFTVGTLGSGSDQNRKIKIKS